MQRERSYVTESWNRICDRLLGTPPGTQTAAGWQTTIDTYSSLGLLPRRVQPGDIVPN